MVRVPPAGLLAELRSGLGSKGARVVAARAFRRDRLAGVAALLEEALGPLAGGAAADVPG